MAIFNKINQKSGVVVTVIAIGLILFLLGGEFFGPNSYFTRGKYNVGEIAGNTISYEEYRAALDMAERDWMVRTGRAIGENDRQSVQEQAWNRLIYKYVYQPEFEKLGLMVTADELIDMVQGENIHPTIRQLFTNPQTQQFDREFLREFLRNFSKREPRDQELWLNIENSLPEERLRNKYANLLKKSVFVTSEEARFEHMKQNARANIKHLFIPYYSIQDTAIEITDKMLQKYLSENKDRYKVEAGRSFDYVVFSAAPSTEDTLLFRKEMEDLFTDFAEAEDDSAFVRANADNPADPEFKSMGDLPDEMKALAGTLEKGKVYGPYTVYGKVNLYKVTDIGTDSIYSARASHILFDTRNKSRAEKDSLVRLGNKVLAEIKAGASFEEKAREYGSDGTASQGGDLGWFTEGRMVKPFNDAIFNARSAGLLPRLVETEFGMHIIKITEPRINKKFLLAVVDREISATDDTREEMYRKADAFSANSTDTASFNANLRDDPSLRREQAVNVRKTDRNVNVLSNARDLIRWAYNESDIGKVSPVFTIDNQFVVAVLTGKREEGTASLDDVRDEITLKVRNEEKAKQIIAKLQGRTENLDKMAAEYGPGATVGDQENLMLSSGSIQGIGYDPGAVGLAFGLKDGSRSAPFKGENGIIIIEMVKYTPEGEIADYQQYRTQLQQQRSSGVEYRLDEALKKRAEITDNRYKFF